MRRKLIDLAARLGIHVRLWPLRIRRTARVYPRLGKVRGLLGDRLAEPARIEHAAPDTDLYRRFEQSRNVHKWHHYFPVYDAWLGPLRDRPIRMLEIGVFRGGSLDLWKGWLHPESIVVGLDIDPDCARHDDPGRGIHVRIGDQCDGDFLASVVEEFGPFDVILDDGGHASSQMIASFNHLFRDGLAEGGLYLVEDMHACYWPGLVDAPMSFMEFCKALVELIHAPYFGMHSIAPYEFRGGGEGHGLDATWIEAWLHGVSFYDSIAVLQKRRRIVPVWEQT